MIGSTRERLYFSGNRHTVYCMISRGAALVLVLIAVCCFFLPSPVSAHPPSAVDLSYDPGIQQLTVAIDHPVNNPVTHYIYRIEISRNNEIIQVFNYTSQPTTSPFNYSYSFPAASGDEFRATAYCSVAGSLTGQLKTPASPAESTTSPSRTEQPPLLSLPGTPAIILPLLWPYHALLMVTGFLLMFSAMLIARYRWGWIRWYKAHHVLTPVGGALSIAALLIAIYMVAATGGPHLRVPHAWLGAIIIALILVTIGLGFLRKKWIAKQRVIRPFHVWSGRVMLALMAVNIAYSGSGL